MNYNEWVEKYREETHNEHNIKEWHEAGYKGRGVKILNLEGYSGHGKKTYDTIVQTAPEAQVDWCYMGFSLDNDKLYHLNIETKYRKFNLDELNEFGEFIKGYNIITVSQTGSYGSQLEDLFSESRAILVSSAGNDDFDGVTGKFKDIGYSIGAVEYRAGEIVREGYSAVGEKVDFVCFHYEKEGTSFSAPTFAGLCALILCKYPELDKYTMYEVMKSICLDLGDSEHDKHFGHGLPVLPNVSKMDTIVNNILKTENSITEPIIEEEKEVDENMKMYLVRYAHLDEVRVKAGDHLKPAIAWGGKVSPASEIGVQGNTGLSTGTHLHIDVVEVPFDSDYVYEKYTQTQIYNGNPKANKEQLDLFVDGTLFEDDYVITTQFNDESYYQQFGWRHMGYDVVSKGNKVVYWNRSFAGRVIVTGYDNSYGNYVVAAYLTLDFNSYKDDELITQELEQPIKIDGQNDLSKTWLNSVGNWMYNMSNKSDVKSTWGQTSDFDGKVRYIEMHPNNLGIVTAKATTDEIGYAGINATFFGITKEGWYYPTSILKLKNAIIQGNANHLPYPQGTFCYYQDGTFGIEQLKSVNELSKPVWYAIGGIEYVRDSMVTYNATAEGFVGIYSDVHRRTTHVSIGLTKEGKILLTRHWDSTRAECAVHMKEMGCIYAIGLDGGGSAQYITPDEKRASTRKVANHLVATDLKI